VCVCVCVCVCAGGGHTCDTNTTSTDNSNDCDRRHVGCLPVSLELLWQPALPSDVCQSSLLHHFCHLRLEIKRSVHECAKCVKAEAHLAAIVMMGGLLEALFVARANKMPDKTPLTAATNAPKDKATGRTTNYQDWMLDSYIKVGCELKWITESAKDVADKLKEYRNFIHPAKELRYGVTLGLNDSSIFWQVTKALTRQLLQTA